MSYRQDLEARGLVLPAGAIVLWDTERKFGYQSPQGMVVGFNKCEFAFWRNRDPNDPSAPAPGPPSSNTLTDR